jgi:hypothetical protein
MGWGVQVRNLCEIYCLGRYILTDSRGVQLEAHLDSSTLPTRNFEVFV